MKRKLFVLLAMSALMLSACAKDNTSSVSESSVTPTPSSETTSTPESSEQSSEVSSEVSSEEESSSEESSSEEPVVIEIHSVTISGIIAPVAGEQAKFDFVVETEHVALDMETTAWTYDVGGTDYYFATPAGAPKTFESGTIYGLSLKLVTEDDAKFASDATISIRVDGDPIELEDIYWGSSHTTATAEYHFEKLPGKTRLHALQISNLPAAEVGGHPASLLSIKVEPSTYVQMLTSSESNLCWIYMNGSTPTFFARGGDQEKTFEAGTEYGVCFIVECKNEDEYTFAEDLTVTSAYGEVVAVEKCGTGSLKRRITISYGVF